LCGPARAPSVPFGLGKMLKAIFLLFVLSVCAFVLCEFVFRFPSSREDNKPPDVSGRTDVHARDRRS
jgi:hypothetical protein